jgi:3-dehydroquinate synthase II
MVLMAIQLYGYNAGLTRDGEALSITSLKPGDKVLAYAEHSGRHFGMKVEESLIER